MKKLQRALEPADAPVGLGRAALHLAALTSFALAWQYLQPLSSSSELFLEHGISGTNLVVFALALVVLPPVVLLAIEALAGLVSKRLRATLHLLFVCGFFALIAWQFLFEASPGLAGLLIYPASLAAGLIATVAYWRFDPIRQVLSVLSVIPVFVLVFFLALSPARVVAFGADGPSSLTSTEARTPVVMIVLDEFPVSSLMRPDGEVDAVRYPHFASLARRSTWYRNAATVGDYTKIAVPAILTGETPTPGVLPVAGKHPNNLFRLLAGSYHLDVTEFLTRLCDERSCPIQQGRSVVGEMRSLFGDLEVARIPALPPAISFRLAGRLRPTPAPAGESQVTSESVRRDPDVEQEARVDGFLGGLGKDSEPTLNFLHLLLPHHAWTRLPNGQAYTREGSPFVLHPAGRWRASPDFTAIAYQRHLLQVAYTDKVIGRVLSRLKALGTYEKSLIVITADHGVSFRPGEETRTASDANIGDIAPVPLFVKAPGQRTGRVDDAPVQTTDILPTIAKEIDATLPWDTAGMPADEVAGDRGGLRVQREGGGGPVSVDRRELVRRRAETVRRKTALFGVGDASLYALGGRSDLIGRPADGALVGRPGTPRASILDAQRYQHVRLASRELPAEVSGEVTGSAPARRRLAVAANGRVCATAWTIPSGGSEYYSAVCDPDAFRPGRNRIEVYELAGPKAATRLVPLG